MNFINSNWTNDDYDKLIKYLKDISDENYKIFHQKLVPSLINNIGVQMPKLRDIAKEISKGNYNEYFCLVKHEYYEETVIQGLVIGYIQADYNNILELIKSFLPHINNWSVCDSFCKAFKPILKNKEEFLDFLKECIKSEKEYYIRFAVIMFKVVYIEEKHIDKILEILDNIHHEGYYVKMAVAWTLCDCFIKFENTTMNYLKSSKLDNFTYNKTLQKILESNRVGSETKDLILKMKRK